MNEENNFYSSEQGGFQNQDPYMGGSMNNNYNDSYDVNNYGSGKGQNTSMGIASLVCGIVSILGVCCLMYILPFMVVVSPILAVLAIVFGIIQIVKNEKKGMAIAGIICGVIAVLLFIGFFVLGLMGFAMLQEMGLDPNASDAEIMDAVQNYMNQ